MVRELASTRPSCCQQWTIWSVLSGWLPVLAVSRTYYQIYLSKFDRSGWLPVLAVSRTGDQLVASGSGWLPVLAVSRKVSPHRWENVP